MATGASILIEVDDASVEAVLLRLAAAGKNAAPFMRDVGAYLLTATQRRFVTTSGPGGVAWKRLAPRTARERIKRGYGTANILRRTGMLYSSLTFIAGERDVEVGTNNPYAAVHQFGAEITQFARSQMAYRHVTETRTKTKDGETKSSYTIDWRFRSRQHSNFATWSTIGEHKVTIPARPYLGLDEADTRAIVEIGEDFLAGVIGGAP